MCSKVTASGTNTANCAIDKDVFLATLADLSGNQTIQTQAGSSEELNMTCETEELTAQTQLNIVPEQLADIQTDYTDENIISYSSGYLIRKIADHNCSDATCCVQNLKSNLKFTSHSQTFMYHKALLRKGSDFGGLICPSDTFVSFVTDIEQLFRTEINGMYHTTGISRRLEYKMDAEIYIVLPLCSVAVMRLIRVFVTMRLHAASKFFSRDLVQLSTGKKNRKACKVMHL